MNDDLISREALKKALEVTQYNDIDDLTRTERLIDNALTVEVPENTVNCVLTMFGKCSYNETGCSDCEIKDKIRKALERPHVEYPKADSHKAYWDNVGRVDMREAENDSSLS